jgi:hypothetical protein
VHAGDNCRSVITMNVPPAPRVLAAVPTSGLSVYFSNIPNHTDEHRRQVSV